MQSVKTNHYDAAAARYGSSITCPELGTCLWTGILVSPHSEDRQSNQQSVKQWEVTALSTRKSDPIEVHRYLEESLS